jgi:hypothetical protein
VLQKQRIRTEDGTPGFVEDNGSPRRSGDDLQLRDYNTRPHVLHLREMMFNISVSDHNVFVVNKVN